MRQPVRHFVRICAETLPVVGPVYEFGALQVTGSPSENLRPLFKGHDYVGADMREGKGVDKVLDLHAIDLESESVGCVICVDTLEHVEYPRRAIDEMHRILKPEGFVVVSSVFEFPIHDHPNDFWRFTPEGFKSLLNPFATSFVGSFGREPENPQTVVGVGFKQEVSLPERFFEDYAKWEKWYTALIKEA